MLRLKNTILQLFFRIKKFFEMKCRDLFTSFVLLALANTCLSACNLLSNDYDEDTALCGARSHQENRTGLYQFFSLDGQAIDLNLISFQLTVDDLKEFPNESYNTTSNGCLAVSISEAFHIHLPGKGLYAENLDPTKRVKNVVLTLDNTLPTIHFPIEKEIFPSNAFFSIMVEDNVKIKYCLESKEERFCKLDTDLRKAFSSEEFHITGTGEIPLPQEEGNYVLYILAQNRPGNIRLLTRPISIDPSIPNVTPDFVGVFETVLYDGEIHYYLPDTYSLGFISESAPIFSLDVEYCHKPPQDNSEHCDDQERKILGISQPEKLAHGRLLYRAINQAGTRSGESWSQIRILSKVRCPENFIFDNGDEFRKKSCTELMGTINIARLPLKNWTLADKLVHISGDVYLEGFEDQNLDFITIPRFQNLHSVSNIIITNSQLEEVDSFPNLIKAKTIEVGFNDHLKFFRGLNLIKSLEYLKVYNNPELMNFRVFTQLEEVKFDLLIIKNPLITQFNFLKNIKKTGNLTITNNYELESINLQSLRKIDKFIIGGSFKINSLNGLQNINKAYEIVIGDTSIKNLHDLNGLQELEYGLTLRNNNQLESLDGLENFQTVSMLEIIGNDQLKSISALKNLQSVKLLRIRGNPFIEEISELDQLKEYLHDNL